MESRTEIRQKKNPAQKTQASMAGAAGLEPAAPAILPWCEKRRASPSIQATFDFRPQTSDYA
jgi:hypothetical protein